MLRASVLLLLLLLQPALQKSPPPAQPTLSDARLSLVTQRLAESANASWELGARSLALISLQVPLFNPFNFDQHIPPPSSPSSPVLSSLAPVFQIANYTLSHRPSSPLPNPPLFNDSSAADPASLGTAVLIANWTGMGEAYGKAAQDELAFLFSSNVPKTSDGAFSHRLDQLQLWSDFVYMVPPFLAYYGALNGNQSLVMEAYNQIRLYRNYLHDSTTNMWRHIALGTSGNDPGFWATGNGWAALGMLRVLAIIQQSSYANQMTSEQGDLATWVGEIHSGVYSFLNSSTNLFTNYVNNPSTFFDASSTAILAASVYRVSTLWGDHRYVNEAESCRKTLVATNNSTSNSSSGSSSGSPDHINSQGWLNPVVNPDSVGSLGATSPEGEAFVVEMEAAWRDWVADGSRGSTSGCRRRGLGQWGVVWWGAVVLGMGLGLDLGVL